MGEKDIEDFRLARPIAIVDLLSIDDRINKLEDVVNRLERVVEALLQLYRNERIKSWELILNKMVDKELQKKKGNYVDRAR
jgi:myosin-crossreactive antigen